MRSYSTARCENQGLTAVPAALSASWINEVERWLAEFTRKQLQRGVHRPTAEGKAPLWET